MSNVVVLVDYMRGEQNQGIIMDMGDDLKAIGDQLRIAEHNAPPGAVFAGAYVLEMHEDQPSNFYVPDNAFGAGLALDGSAQLPMGKRWFSLIMKVEPGAFAEEE